MRKARHSIFGKNLSKEGRAALSTTPPKTDCVIERATSICINKPQGLTIASLRESQITRQL